MKYMGREVKINSTEYKIIQKRQYLQRLIDIPYERWEDYDHWYNENKPFYVAKNVFVDIIDGEVIVGGVETKEEIERFGWLL